MRSESMSIHNKNDNNRINGMVARELKELKNIMIFMK